VENIPKEERAVTESNTDRSVPKALDLDVVGNQHISIS
jgi:hypothetical protein